MKTVEMEKHMRNEGPRFWSHYPSTSTLTANFSTKLTIITGMVFFHQSNIFHGQNFYAGILVSDH